MANVNPPQTRSAVVDGVKFLLTDGWLRFINQLYLWVNNFNSQIVNVSISASTTGSVTLINQSWVTLTSVITAQVGLPTGMSVATFVALNPQVVISAQATGTFTINVAINSAGTHTFPVSIVGHL